MEGGGTTTVGWMEEAREQWTFFVLFFSSLSLFFCFSFRV